MLRAIVCDDEKAAYDIIRYFLKEEALPVELVGYAEDGKKAVEMINEMSPDLIFLDINMPELSGFQVIDRIGKEYRSRIIILTAYDSFNNAREALRLGVRDILSKPVDLEQLKKTITDVIGWEYTANKTVNQILEYLHEHFREEIELKDIAEMTFHTESHLARLFKKHLDISILAYVHKLRIEEACRLMESGAEIQDVAEQVGYASLNNFYKYFKRFIGVTPRQYREEKQVRP